MRGHAGGVERTQGFSNFLKPGFSATQFIRQFITSIITAKFCIFRIVGRLRLLGAHVLEADHHRLGPALVERYLQVKQEDLL